jgi:recombination protein RecT
MAMAAGGNKALIQQTVNRKIEEGAPLAKGEFSAVVRGFRRQIEEALPAHLKNNADKYARQAITLFTQNPTLQKCAPMTILTSLMSASALGLDLSPVLGQGYIIPYQVSRRDGQSWTKVWEAQFQIGYRGMIALAQRSGTLARIHADVVREKDKFRFSKGLSPVLEHEESYEEDRGGITHVYAVANFTNGGYAFEVWPLNRVVAHAKRFSQSFYKDEYRGGGKTGRKVENPSSPWIKDFESMAKKTLIKSIWKYLPLSTEVMLSVESSDEAIKTDIEGLTDERDIINIAPRPMDDEEFLPDETSKPDEPDKDAETPGLRPLDKKSREGASPPGPGLNNGGAGDESPAGFEPSPAPAEKETAAKKGTAAPEPVPAAAAGFDPPPPANGSLATQPAVGAMWRAYVEFFKGDRNAAEREARAVAGNKATSKWTAADIVALGKRLDELKREAEAVNAPAPEEMPPEGADIRDSEMSAAMEEAAAFL